MCIIRMIGHISYSRHIWPSVKSWNPTRILPEILMPLAAQIGVSVLMPLTGDYIGSMAYAFAAVLSVFIVFYILSFGKLILNRFALAEKTAVCLMTVVFLLSFLPFITDTERNAHLFYSASVTTTFYYTIPALLNSSLVLYMLNIDKHSLLKNTNFIKTGELILAIYLCINSNMFQSIIISSYAAAYIIYESIFWFKKQRYHKHAVLSFISDHFNQLFILCLWFISLYFESQGRRAAQISSDNSLNLQGSLQSFISSLNQLNSFYIVQLCCIIGAATAIVFWKYKKTQGQQENLQLEKTLIKLLGISVIACIGTILYLIILEAVTNGGYISNANCMISWMFWLFVIETASLAYLAKKIPASKVGLPLFILCLVFETFMHGSRYKDIAYGAPKTLKEIDDYMLQQVTDAEESGQNYIEVHIPLHNDSGWPLNVFDFIV